MVYKYLPALLTTYLPPNESWRQDFQQLLWSEFNNASTLYTIQEEAVFASSTYSDVSVHVNHAIDARTGTKMGDDYKLILFSDLEHITGLGYMYYFDDNYWIVVNSEIIKNLASSCTVRRCNNTLRWLDSSGGYHSQPCAIDTDLLQNKNYKTSQSAVVEPMGTLNIITQFNVESNLIKENKRFLFGNENHWFGYKIQGGGVGNFNNLSTLKNASAGLLGFTMIFDYVNTERDDLVNGVAIDNVDVYTIQIKNGNVSGSIGNTLQLTYAVQKDGITSQAPVVWRSSNTNIATVNSSGLLTFVANGNCSITCTIENASISSTITVTVSTTPSSNFEVLISPSANYIYEHKSKTYSVFLYKDGVQQSDIFAFSIVPSQVPVDNYVFDVVDANNFKITNQAFYAQDSLEILCVSGTYSKTLSVWLKGKF